MDCRVKPGNDDVTKHSRDAFSRPSFADDEQSSDEANVGWVSGEAA
jgi:hypothetical protein